MASPSRDLQRRSRALLRDPIDGAIDVTVAELRCEHPEADPHALRVALLAALSDELSDATKEAALDARRAGTTWRALSEALGLSLSAVRHRYDEGTVAARRRYDHHQRGRG